MLTLPSSTPSVPLFFPTDPELDGHSFIAVYDGHGGQYSAIYCGEHMISFLKKTKGFEEYKKTKDVTHLQVCFPPSLPPSLPPTFFVLYCLSCPFVSNFGMS